MDLRYPPDVEAFRAEVRAILAEELPADFAGLGAIEDRTAAEDFVESWRATLYRRGLLGVTWPVEYGGRGLSRLHQVALVEELARAGVPYGAPYDTYAIKMLGSTLLRFGTPAQKERFLPRILSGEEHWCQGYSEPEAGSDLAALRTRAHLEGDEWVVTGQKIWTSHAFHAGWIFMLARTDPDAARNRGISFLLVPIHQPGIEIRRIRQMTGESEFCEVFVTEARTAAENVVGAPGEGWKVATALLGHERGEEAATNPILFRSELDRLIRLAQQDGKAGDPVVRQRLADAVARVEVMRHLGYRILTGLARGGELAATASVAKLYWSEYHQRVTDLAEDILGLRGQVLQGRPPLRAYRADDPGVPSSSTASWAGAWMAARSGTIYAGASEIQRNIIAETILGLPREPRPT
ncbi:MULTISPECIES: acyl-CoA dehydrogenase family protein [unclassified Pseudofrankia]|uniref:acyl-CoA dehydrogenase family protein n=1 Tax=unclassified Pseudofrankia TaxID=2994372 RepID=UPI0008DA996C|nr:MULTISPECIES: acyl-CoA dehydrogenase family protein [unclassified Pseudofrankia]MDT3441958.1 acyl-CoA dehydrogenase family protein [Pseudofrankia sp. BMG5.37]OHV44591.1 acyl-CoA dehydrogenase [Pseudofrankia sp. BMG5.36]